MIKLWPKDNKMILLCSFSYLIGRLTHYKPWQAFRAPGAWSFQNF